MNNTISIPVYHNLKYDDAKKVIKNIRYVYENHHNVIYDEQIVDLCVKLADRYINDRAFPDKAIDILDQAGSKCKTRNYKRPESAKKLEQLMEKSKSESEVKKDF